MLSEAVTPCPLDADHEQRKREDVRHWLGNLTVQEQTVLTQYYGLDGDPKTLAQIAKVMGLSPERIADVRRKAVAKLQDSARKALIGFKPLVPSKAEKVRLGGNVDVDVALLTKIRDLEDSLKQSRKEVSLHRDLLREALSDTFDPYWDRPTCKCCGAFYPKKVGVSEAKHKRGCWVPKVMAIGITQPRFISRSQGA